MRYETGRLVLRPLSLREAPLLLEYHTRNREFFRPWDPLRQDDWFTRKTMKTIITRDTGAMRAGTGLVLYLFRKPDLPGNRQRERDLIGRVELSGIIYGPFLSCFLGYRLDRDAAGRGYMTEALRKLIDIAFSGYRLHRIEANVMPRNAASVRVLEKLGFGPEGLSRKYLRINGVWEDHLHYVLLNDEV